MWSHLLDLLFPKYSLSIDGTGVEGEWISPSECAELRGSPVILSTARLRASGLRAIDRIVAAAEYQASPLLRPAIHTFKYRRVPALGPALGRMMVEASRASWSGSAPVLCAVPLHWTRRFQRGFNQAELLAREVARSRGCPVLPLLRRVRPTGHQARRGRSERFAAMKSAFRARASEIPPYVVLVDDLSTTGATLDACAEALKEAGALRVEGLVIAHG